MHRIREFPVTSAEMRKELLHKYNSEWGNTNRGKEVSIDLRSDALKKPMARATTDRYHVVLHHKVAIIALRDTGADANARYYKIFEKLKKEHRTIEERIFMRLVSLNKATLSSEEKEFTAERDIIVSVHILLPGCNLPLRIHKVPFYDVDQLMKE